MRGLKPVMKYIELCEREKLCPSRQQICKPGYSKGLFQTVNECHLGNNVTRFVDSSRGSLQRLPAGYRGRKIDELNDFAYIPTNEVVKTFDRAPSSSILVGRSCLLAGASRSCRIPAGYDRGSSLISKMSPVRRSPPISINRSQFYSLWYW